MKIFQSVFYLLFVKEILLCHFDVAFVVTCQVFFFLFRLLQFMLFFLICAIMDKNSSFQRLFCRFCKAYPDSSKQEVQRRCVEFWNGSKQLPDFQHRLAEKEKELDRLAMKKKKRVSDFFQKATTKTSQTCLEIIPPQVTEIMVPEIDPESPASNPGPSRTYKCHKQEQLQSKLSVLNADILGLEILSKNNVITPQQEKDLRQHRIQKTGLEKELTKLIDNQQRQQQFRNEKKRKNDEIFKNDPTKATKKGIHQTPGRPRRENEDEILKAILEIAQY